MRNVPRLGVYFVCTTEWKLDLVLEHIPDNDNLGLPGRPPGWSFTMNYTKYQFPGIVLSWLATNAPFTATTTPGKKPSGKRHVGGGLSMLLIRQIWREGPPPMSNQLYQLEAGKPNRTTPLHPCLILERSCDNHVLLQKHKE